MSFCSLIKCELHTLICVQALKEHKFATPEVVREMCIESYRELKSRSESTLKSMKLYLANKDTEYILFKPIRMNIQSAYSQLQVKKEKSTFPSKLFS